AHVVGRGVVQPEDRRHGARALAPALLHQLTPPPDRAQRVGEGQAARRNVRGELAQRMARGAGDVAEEVLDGAKRRDRVDEDRRLRVARRGQLVLRSLVAQAGEGEAQDVVGLLEGLPRRRRAGDEVTAHPHELRTLPREEEGYHRRTDAAQVNPAPNATVRTFEPGWMRPSSTAS